MSYIGFLKTAKWLKKKLNKNEILKKNIFSIYMTIYNITQIFVYFRIFFTKNYVNSYTTLLFFCILVSMADIIS